MIRQTAYALVLAVLAACPGRACAAGGTAGSANPAVILAKDAVRAVSSPIRYDRRDWLTFAAVAAAGLGLYSVDGDISDFFRRNAVPPDTSRVFKTFGEGKYTVPAMAALYGIGCAAKAGRLKTASTLAVESFLISGFAANAIKLAVHRHRPGSGDGPGRFDGASFSNGDTSFPSGHAAVVFSMAGAFAGVYADKPVVAVTAYSAAVLTGLSRINDDAHWASDVFFGAAIGYFTAKAVVRYHNVRAEAGAPAVVLLPGYSNGPQLTLVRRF
ncbi:MAG: phosphatase PAP2 family protein [Elusimicrobiaceae bacterium]|nr:phosphatase PAP2 family protein [Elusimicrobiaceae bacterium]